MSHIVTKETTAAHLLTLHNVHYQLNLMREAQSAIIADKYVEFVKKFFYDLYNGDKEKYPKWAVHALRDVNIDILE